MEKPNSIATRRVAVQYVIGAVDGADADDEPDFIPARGVVEFTASVAYTPYHVVSGPNPLTVLNAKITGVLNSEGYLCTPDPSNPTLPGKRGVRLVCTDNVDGSVAGWTWTATPRFVDANGTRIPDVIPPFSFYLPADPDPNAPDLDLTTVTKVPASQGIGNAQAEALASLASAAAVSSADAADRAVAAVEEALEAAQATDSGVAGLLRAGAKTSIALSDSVAAQTTQQVPTLVAKAIAADGAVASAAASAVTDELAGRNLVEGSDARLPTITPAGETMFAVADKDGRESWIAARASDGGPTDWAMEHLQGRLGVGPSEVAGYLFAIVDGNNRMTDLAVRASDGQLPDYVIDRLRARILAGYTPEAGVPAPTPARVYADAPYSPGSDILPIHTDMSRAAGWGSSSMEGIGPRLNTLFSGRGATFTAGGKGGEVVEQTVARIGAIPALVTATGGSIPPTGAVPITTSNMPRTSNLKPYSGTLAGVPGTLSHQADPATYIFTRAEGGQAVQVPTDTPFIPDANTCRDALNVLWVGKNSLNSTSGAADKVVQMTNACFDWLAPLRKRCLVLGHFADSDTPAESAERAQILKANAALEARYGRTYIDIYSYLASPQVWVDTGLTPNAADVEAQRIGNKPPSLSQDNAHLNGAANAAITSLIADRLIELGW